MKFSPATSVLWLSLGLLTASACWWRLSSGVGSVTLGWLPSQAPGKAAQSASLLTQLDGCFTDGTCGCFAAGVTNIRAQVGSQSGAFGCDDLLDGGRAGTFLGVPAGTQPYSVAGYGPVFDADSGSTSLVQLSWAGGELDVAEASTNAEPTLPLAWTSSLQGTGDIELLWTFGGHGCKEAGDPDVRIEVSPAVEDIDADAGSPMTFVAPCHANGIDGFRLPNLGESYLRFALIASTADGTVFSASPSAFTNGVTESTLNVDLYSQGHSTAAPPGPLQLELAFGPDGESCATTGVDQLRVRVSYNETGTWSRFFLDEVVPCSDPPSVILSNTGDGGFEGCLTPVCPLPAGEYLIYVDGLSQGSTAYRRQAVSVWCEVGDPRASNLIGDPTEVYTLNVPAVAGP